MSATGFGLSLHPCTIGWRVVWPELAELAAGVGYEGAVIARDQPLPAEPSSAVCATSMLLPAEVRRDDAAYRSTMQKLRAACQFAHSVGCRVATLGVPPSSEQPRAAQAELYRERLKPCCDVLDEFGIRLALECITPLHLRRAYPFEFLMRNEEMLEFGLSVSPHCGLVADAWHWHHGGSDPGWLSGIPPDRIVDAHISDSPPAPADEIRDTERLVPGQGIIDFQLFFELLRQKNYCGSLTVEVFGGGLNQLDPAEAALRAFRASSALLSGAATARDRRKA